jgi:hypothetical protein
MKFFTLLIMVPVSPSFFCWTFHQTSNACLDQGTGSTILHAFVAVLVGGLFLANHFRDKIQMYRKKLFKKGEKGERAED